MKRESNKAGALPEHELRSTWSIVAPVEASLLAPQADPLVSGNRLRLEAFHSSARGIYMKSLIFPILGGGIAIALGAGMTLIAPAVVSAGSAILLTGTAVTNFTTGAGIGIILFGVLGRSAQVFAAGACLVVGGMVVGAAIAGIGAFIVASASIVSVVGNVIVGIGCALAVAGVIHLLHQLNRKYHWGEKIRQRFVSLREPGPKGVLRHGGSGEGAGFQS